MPFINGRYHMNPALGEALEDARSAAEDLLASDDASHNDDFADRFAVSEDRGPIHHIEIESAEVVPSSTGRATHGFVARVHRSAPVGAQQVGPQVDGQSSLGNQWCPAIDLGAAPSTHPSFTLKPTSSPTIVTFSISSAPNSLAIAPVPSRAPRTGQPLTDRASHRAHLRTFTRDSSRLD